MDSDDAVFRCIALNESDAYSEAVMEYQGVASLGTKYAIFYRNHFAWMDRENPDFRLVEEVDYYPRVVDHVKG
jgi:hypothetical protein